MTPKQCCELGATWLQIGQLSKHQLHLLYKIKFHSLFIKQVCVFFYIACTIDYYRVFIYIKNPHCP